MTTNTKFMNYLEALKDNDDRKTNISRITQLNKLNEAFRIAKEQKYPSVMVLAVRKQNEMLGYHRENAPNPEKELAKHKLLQFEMEALQRIARQRTAELSQGRFNDN